MPWNAPKKEKMQMSQIHLQWNWVAVGQGQHITSASKVLFTFWYKVYFSSEHHSLSVMDSIIVPWLMDGTDGTSPQFFLTLIHYFRNRKSETSKRWNAQILFQCFTEYIRQEQICRCVWRRLANCSSLSVEQLGRDRAVKSSAQRN